MLDEKDAVIAEKEKPIKRGAVISAPILF
jgi:hypothetical protein